MASGGELVEVDFGRPARKSFGGRPNLSSGARVPSQSPGPSGSRFSRPMAGRSTRGAADDSSMSGSSPSRGFRTPVTNPRASKQFEEGQKVKVKKKDLPGYEDATIITKHLDGTYDVNYSNSGRDERKVAAVRVALRPTDFSSEEVKSDNTRPEFRMGQKVNAMYRERGSFKPAKVLNVNSRTGKLDIRWDDGLEENDGKSLVSLVCCSPFTLSAMIGFLLSLFSSIIPL